MKACRLVWADDAVAGVDQDHGEVAGRGAGRHVARVLLVAWGIGDDKGPPGGGKKAIGDIDRDPLLALVFEPVEQQGKVDRLAGGAEPARLALERLELVVEDQRAIVQQPSDQGRLAVVDRAAGQKAQQIPFARHGRGIAQIRHQK